ncbi:UdgX family uracil-DNA binding protein [Streptomyces lydicus]|uniref:Type-4 uracil-DNA glycosylase n=1 Tax=Streptomyces lydicus TaxID=47763 RepID=A0A1D7VLK4_9ACTN|nr:UdgX family uracil-DNA binding protein [Streptomyces lydicus]AOP47388.1 uracil-DNA glycosylase [Streptomyces lydicus]
MPSTNTGAAGSEPDDPGRRYDATPYLPARGGLPAHRRAAAGCRGCPLHREATQTVFGAGTSSARTVFVGEQPGDQEDRRGEPFVGPAGRLLRKAMAEAGLAEDQAYFTNAVKHFKFTVAAGGRRRIHKAPNLREMTACRPWLYAELRLVAPEVIVVLGATAAKALLGPSFRVTKERGAPVGSEHGTAVATVHPSAILRSDDRAAAYAGLVTDLRTVAGLLA